jgi:hypothetical protein
LFKKLAFFNSTSFYSKAALNSRFIGEADFREAKFLGETDFGRKIHFCSFAAFDGAKFTGSAYFNCIFDTHVTFDNVLFKSGNSVVFDMNDLSKISFVNTDITRLRFSEDTYWGPKHRFEVLEERLLLTSLEPLFDWNEFPANGLEEGKVRALLQGLGIKWIAEVEFTRIDERTIRGIRSAHTSDTSPINVKFPLERQDPFEIQENICEAFDVGEHLVDIVLQENNQIYIKIDNYLYRGPWRLFARNEKGNLKVYMESASLRKIKAIYRNLRENYEYNLRYEEASEFFKREMELKRNYKQTTVDDGISVKKNDRLRRYISLTGLYYILSLYGESLLRPTIFLATIVIVSTLSWLATSSPNEMQPSHTPFSNHTLTVTVVTRTVIDMMPFIPLSSGAGLGDIALKSIGVVMIGLLIIALRRRFERRFRH